MFSLTGVATKLLAGLALLGGVIAAIFAGQRSAKRAGATENEAAHTNATAQAAASRVQTDDAVRRQTAAEQTESLAKWERR